MKTLIERLSTFTDSVVAGFILESALGPDSNIQNVIESVAIGSGLGFFAVKYTYKIPVLGKLFREHDRNITIVTETLPYATAGLLVGQTLAKYLQ